MRPTSEAGRAGAGADHLAQREPRTEHQQHQQAGHLNSFSLELTGCEYRLVNFIPDSVIIPLNLYSRTKDYIDSMDFVWRREGEREAS